MMTAFSLFFKSSRKIWFIILEKNLVPIFQSEQNFRFNLCKPSTIFSIRIFLSHKGIKRFFNTWHSSMMIFYLFFVACFGLDERFFYYFLNQPHNRVEQKSALEKMLPFILMRDAESSENSQGYWCQFKINCMRH